MEKSRVLERGLAVLDYFVQHRAGSLTDVASALDLSPPAASRALEALCAAGYLSRRGARAPYRLTSKLVHLQRGHELDLVVAEVALPLMEGLSSTIGWPSLLGKLDGLELLVMEAVAADSPRAIDLPSADTRMPYFLRAAGTVCVAFKGARERERMVEQTAVARRKHDMALPFSRLEMLHTLARSRGFMEHEPVKNRPVYLAVPLAIPGRDYGLEVSYWPDVIHRATAIKEYLPRLRRIAKAIQAEAERFTAR